MTIISDIIDTLFPPRPTQKVIRDLRPEEIEKFVRPGMYEEIHFLADYSNPTIRALIVENKYHNNRTARALLATLLETWLESQSAKKTFFIPIPLSTKRQKERGYNQVTEILKTITIISSADRLEKLLVRNIDTVPQTSLPRQQRINNMKSAFVVSIDSNLSVLDNSTVVVVDDVLTTGATMAAARAKLAPHLPPSCKLICLALAH